MTGAGFRVSASGLVDQGQDQIRDLRLASPLPISSIMSRWLLRQLPGASGGKSSRGGVAQRRIVMRRWFIFVHRRVD
jgi:hypothetical protein